MSVLATAVLVGLGAAGCGSSDTPPAVSQGKLESSTMDDLERMAGQRPDAVTCEGGLEGVVDNTQRCELTAGPDRLGFTVTVTQVEGDQIDYELQVDELEGDGAVAL